MARWIVAGVLLAVLIALIVVDTSQLEGGVASAPTAVAPDGTASAGGAAPAGTAEGTPPEAATPETLAAVDERPALAESCGKVKASIQAAKGDAYMVALGDAVLVKVTEDVFASACKEIEGLSVDQQVAKLEALAGGPPTVK